MVLRSSCQYSLGISWGMCLREGCLLGSSEEFWRLHINNGSCIGCSRCLRQRTGRGQRFRECGEATARGLPLTHGVDPGQPPGSARHCPFLTEPLLHPPPCTDSHRVILETAAPRPPHSSEAWHPAWFLSLGCPSHEGLSTGLVFRNTWLKITVAFISAYHLCLKWAQLVLMP